MKGNLRNIMRPYCKRRFNHADKMLAKIKRRSLSEFRIARADRAVDAAMIPY